MFGAFFNVKGAAAPAFSVKTLLLVWVVAEVIALVIAVKLLGLGGTVLLTILSSLLGVTLMRRIGLEAAGHLRRSMTGEARDGTLLDGTLAALGALLLIVPGFVSDMAGMALAAPSIRRAILGRLGASSAAEPGRPKVRPQSPDLIDLSPDDWRVVEPSRRR